MEHISIWPVLVLALIHAFGSKLRFLGGVPRSIWLSAAGGTSVAYVFLYLFPALGEGQAQVQRAFPGESFLRHHVYIMALLGLTAFYGLERAVVQSKQQNEKTAGENKASAGVFWLHMASFGVYNALIGYLLFQREEGTTQQLILFSTAMGLHFLVNDFGLLSHHQERYKKAGRWVLVAALIIGWSIGYLLVLSHTLIVLLVAFIGGGVILNVLKEELPEEHESRFWAFVLGAAAYAILLLSLTS
ncbi:hypothetical protein [Pontibacter liquoris]|uniref:hypothetical protein n=1 Tax=Pontibacter liquoris TaxID=2905677 RepID=UPI001FA6CB11|nr:hypothetical protein [Pontibacter liquoris]